MKTVKELLRFARGRVSLPGSWCRGWEKENAVCVVHALHLGMSDEDWQSGERVYDHAIKLVAEAADCPSTGPSLGWKNDIATHEEVIEWLDKAILKCDETVAGT